MTDERSAMPEHSASDSELLLRLRRGDRDAYEALWSRHVGAALRLGRRLDPGRAEDLVSEAFFAVYRQVTTTDSGPTTAFRAYLFTVMRNTAMRWGRESERVEVVPELEEIAAEDGLVIVEREAGAAEVLAAFRELPERWQRVLWLSEVEEVARPKIAAELGITPNAVSSLHRRARADLLLRWLTRQVPAPLRDDARHAARLFPHYLAGKADGPELRFVEAHLPECGSCAELLADLQGSSSALQRAALSSLGFAALGATVPAALPVSGTAAVGGASLLLGAVSGIGTTGIFVLGGLGLAASGVVFALALLTGSIGGAAEPRPEPTSQPGTSETTASAPVPEERAPIATIPDEVEVIPVPSDDTTPGRHNTNSSIREIEFAPNPVPPVLPVPPEPAQPGTVPDPEPEPNELSPGMTTPAASSGYLPPVIGGKTEPGAQVAVSFDGQTYSATTSDAGDWSFDLRAFDLQYPAAYEYQVWAYTDARRSAVQHGTFTVTPPGVRGIDGQPALDLAEAKSTGLVVTFQGPPNGTMFVVLTAGAGQLAAVPLDENGTAIRRLRMLAGGTYTFLFRPSVDGFFGGVAGYAVPVTDPAGPVQGPWGPGDELAFELSEP